VSGWSALLPAWASVLVVAGLAKLRRPDETARALVGALGGDRVTWGAAVRAGALAEALVGALSLLSGGRWAALAVCASYTGFAVYVSWARLSRRPLATCGCLGEPDTPPTWIHSALCAAAALTAAVAALGTSPPPSLASMLGSLGRWSPADAAAAGASAYANVLVLGAGPRLSLLRRAPR
jgi:hypothetical protein